MIPKHASYRNRALLDLAHRIHECTLSMPGCIGYSVEGCEPCHANWAEFGKGGAQKADDCYFAAGCRHCHQELDQGKTYTKDEKRDFWMAGYIRTQYVIYQNGWLKVAA